MKRLLLFLALFTLSAISCNLATQVLTSLIDTDTPPEILADSFFSGYAYVDANGNKQIDESDPPLEGAMFTLAGFGDTTDANGMAFITIPGGWERPVLAQMRPPKEGGYTLIGPNQVTLQSPGKTRAEFLFGRSEDRGVPESGVRLENGEYDLTYCITSDGLELKMDIFPPEDQDNPAPLVIYVHGGGWTQGDKSEGIGLIFARRLVDAGYTFVSINYRLAPKYQFPAHIEDVRCAVRHLRAEAAQYNIDPERIGAIGGSAGGHLVALLGLVNDPPDWQPERYLESYDDQSSRVAAVVDMFGPTGLSDQLQLSDSERANGEIVFGAAGINDPVLTLYSPLTYVSVGDPPFLIIHGQEDDLVPPQQSKMLYQALEADGIPTELVWVANAGHGLSRTGGGQPDPSLPKLQRIVLDFFNRYMR
jgi:acetyl esterase/lipase